MPFSSLATRPAKAAERLQRLDALPHQHPDILVNNYPLRMRGIFVLVILGVATFGYMIPKVSNNGARTQHTVAEMVEQINIPPTEQFIAPPAATRPSIPVASEDEDLAEDITIEETGLDDFDWEAPPPPPATGPVIVFVAYSVAPEPIGGYKSILKYLEYPAIAREAGIEGQVVVQAHIDVKGHVIETVVLRGVPATGLDEAAAKAVERTRFSPALQRDRPVAVWIAIPIVFSLDNSN